MIEQAHKELSTLRDYMRFAVSRFNAGGLFFGHGTDNAWDEAAYLLLHTLHLPLDRLEPFMDAHLIEEERLAVVKIIERRITERLPAAYLTNEAWLGEYRFYVDPRVIIPRSHIAELLREQLSPWIGDPWAVGKVLDLCTGSGCLAILAAIAFPESTVDAVDISADALAVARRNVDDYDLAARVRLVESDAFAAIPSEKYDVIISNPPYVNAASMASLPEEYRREPQLALASGEDGLDFVRRLLAEAATHLKPDGLLVVEIGHNRDELERAFPDTSFIWLDTSAGDRYVFLLRRSDLPRS
ncbi:50S ribosomal protein L3 N(5)-glutamine methyltransferase [Propionivibrio soli]|uniref:50S ribosomal protein L3 N(5)-glutamine methyltransferase n=1 Tax=Propionivibrio soli TaxID=2976531 RepID=UPI0021E8F213|nr:50S ribosomal protein L3 N(5)-glutamine methyltransferase [Propionivibrio soli]